MKPRHASKCCHRPALSGAARPPPYPPPPLAGEGREGPLACRRSTCGIQPALRPQLQYRFFRGTARAGVTRLQPIPVAARDARGPVVVPDDPFPEASRERVCEARPHAPQLAPLSVRLAKAPFVSEIRGLYLEQGRLSRASSRLWRRLRRGAPGGAPLVGARGGAERAATRAAPTKSGNGPSRWCYAGLQSDPGWLGRNGSRTLPGSTSKSPR